MKRAISMFMLIAAVGLFGVYVSSVRANGQQAPVCEDDPSGFGVGWKWGYCHQGHPICSGDATEVRNHTGHTTHGSNNPNNPPNGCFFMGCCEKVEDVDCKKVTGGK